MRLAYKDLEQHRKIEEQKLKGLDGKKKEQAERLGMGLGIRRCVVVDDDDDEEETSHPVRRVCFHTIVFAVFCSEVSHSVTSDMHIIQQENPRGAKTTRGRRFAEEEDDEGCFSSRSGSLFFIFYSI